MPRYRAKSVLWVNSPEWIGARQVEAGAEFTSNDIPGVNWEPVDDEARSAYRARHGRDHDRKAQAFGVGGGDNSLWQPARVSGG